MTLRLVSASPRRPRRVARAVGAVALVVLVVVAGAIGTRLAGDALQRDGIARFYKVPADAANGGPGSLIKSEPLLSAPLASRGWRIMYWSTDLNGDPVAVTGIVVTPLGPAPAGGRTVVSWGHPTTGSARECAPSYGFDPYVGIEGVRTLLDRGYTVVATDYAGMGVAGPDSYLIGSTEGRNVLDAVRAAQQLPEAEAGSDVVLWGHSQGGQAVLFAAQLASSYAPKLHIAAVATAAPAADLSALMTTHLDDVSGVTIGSYAFSAFAQVYGDRGARLDGILTPEALAIQPEMNSLCLLSHIDQLHALAQPVVGRFTTADPTVVEPWATLLTENSAGDTVFDAPLLVTQGLRDELVRPADTEEFIRSRKEAGMDVTYRTVADATHGTIAYLSLVELSRVLDRIGT